MAQLADGRLAATWSGFGAEQVFVRIGDLPSITATVAEGAAHVPTHAELPCSDPDDAPADVTFTLSCLVNGEVRVNGVTQSTFTSRRLAGGTVTCVQDG